MGRKRFDLALLIVHPNLDPADISTSLGLDAHHVQQAGKPIRTPLGIELPESYFDSRWRYVERYETTKQLFALKLTRFVKKLSRHKDYFRELCSSGGSAEIIISFLGDGHYGDIIPPSTLAAISEIRLGLGIEVFSSTQS